jgi:hypothetical protein
MPLPTDNQADTSAFDDAFGDAIDGTPQSSTTDDIPADDPPAGDIPTDDPPADEPPASTPPPTPDPTIAQLLDKIAALEQRVTAPVTQAPTAPPAPEPPKTFEFPAPTAEDTKAWDDFRIEYPEHAAVIEKRTLTLENTLKAAFKFITDQIDPLRAQIAPLAQNAVETAEEKFANTLKAKHPDAGTLYPELQQWIEKLPRHRSVGANYALDRGTAEDVIELYNEFKKETGRVVTQPPPQIPPATQSPDVASRLKRLEAVPSRRTNHREPDNPDDYDGAFAQAVAAHK